MKQQYNWLGELGVARYSSHIERVMNICWNINDDVLRHLVRAAAKDP